jgi:hypothetical protein
MSSFLNCLRRLQAGEGHQRLLFQTMLKRLRQHRKQWRRCTRAGMWELICKIIVWNGSLIEREHLGGDDSLKDWSVWSRCVYVRCWGMPSCHSKNCWRLQLRLKARWILDRLLNLHLRWGWKRRANTESFGRRLSLIPDEKSYKIEKIDATKVQRWFRHLAKLRVQFWERWRKFTVILFCGYRGSTIADPWKMHAETYTCLGTGCPSE